MTAIRTATIPYEKQLALQNGRTCGAACLNMVYRSFELDATQEQVWAKVAKFNRFGTMASSTHSMVRDALDRGLAAVAIQAKHPLQALRVCQENGIRVILNHRLKEDLATGHYSVLVEIGSEHVILHDPYFGPERRLPHAELVELWRPRYLNAEIAGNVLIGIAAKPAPMEVCQFCHTPFPPLIDCPSCAKPVPLEPAVLLGCMSFACDSRHWNHLCCPNCDHTWSFGLQTGQAPAPADSRSISVDYNPAFAQLDKLFEHVLSLGPAIANHPDVRQQLEVLKAGKEQLKLAQSEELVRQKMHKAKLAQFEQKCRQQKEAVAKKQEATNQPAAPLDGIALGEDLVRELGLLGEQTPGVPPQPPAQGPRSKADSKFIKMLRKRGLIS